MDLPDIAWVDAIRCASDRIDRLSRTSADRIDPLPPKARPSPVKLGLAFELLRQEKYREALDVLGGLPAADRDPDVQLLRAGLLTICGDLESAEAVCRQILSCDDMNTGAHYLMALCREHAGDTSAAMEHDRTAIYLDGRFAMPHLHLGRVARRTHHIAACGVEHGKVVSFHRAT